MPSKFSGSTLWTLASTPAPLSAKAMPLTSPPPLQGARTSSSAIPRCVWACGDLQPHRALAGDDAGIVIRLDQNRATLGTDARRDGFTILASPGHR